MEHAPSSGTITLTPIGIVRNDIAAPLLVADSDGLKVNDGPKAALKKFNQASDARSKIVIREDLSDLLDGIDDYSHIVVLYWGHGITDAARSLKHVHPVGRTDYPLQGIFSTCSPARPNPVLMTVVRLWGRDGTTLTVSGLDAIDKSPVLDIKPYVGESFPRDGVSVPEWMQRIMGEFRAE
ncbi:SAM-dependent methyltransferase [Methanofollis tationis]|uniref:SAM-dependent methyltransferase n=1 Tax=Methanofollis tationis TaxID=81417 RepID=A0A7K4HNN5_9EURY|nr:SAM-dependent methyltransferase [Methanofollis tationis]NVO66874.1 SAM-dependent methyltransferase [Methanofollis tationis]